MTRVPMGSDAPSDKNSYASESSMSETYFEHFPELTTQGEGAERIADQWGFDRADVDEIAIDSQYLWDEEDGAGHYDGQVEIRPTALRV
jgi:acetyl-CoA acetyltransferase